MHDLGEVIIKIKTSHQPSMSLVSTISLGGLQLALPHALGLQSQL